MRKYLLLLVSAFCITHHAIDIPTLESKAFDSFFKSEHKHKLENALKDKKVNFDVVFKGRTLTQLDLSNLPITNITFEKTTFDNVIFKNADLTGSRFEKVTFHDIDFSNMNLKGIHFIQCMFKNVNFSHADLRDIVLTGSKFKDVNLYDAVLYYPFKASKEEVQKKGFKIIRYDIETDINITNYQDLIKLYNYLVKNANYYLSCYKFLETKKLLEQSKCLNKLFPLLSLNWQGYNLKKINLTGIDLENATLTDAKLQGIKLSQNFTLPDYPENDRTRLFDLWINGTSEEQGIIQKLVNARFDIVTGVDPKVLREGIQFKKDLRNAYLNNANLQGADLTYADLQNASFEKTSLQGANLTQANLKNISLFDARLQKVKLSANVTLPDYPENNRIQLFDLWTKGTLEEQTKLQELVNARFDIVTGLDSKTLQKEIMFKKNLQNMNLIKVNLEGVDLENANLQNANLHFTVLQKTNFKNANLKNANLSFTKANKTDFTIANLKKANLKHVKLVDCILYKTNLKKANLCYADLTKANLKKANLKRAVLEKAEFKEATLEETNLSEARISTWKTLPKNCTDENLIEIFEIYHKNTRRMYSEYDVWLVLKSILESKGLFIE